MVVGSKRWWPGGLLALAFGTTAFLVGKASDIVEGEEVVVSIVLLGLAVEHLDSGTANILEGHARSGGGTGEREAVELGLGFVIRFDGVGEGGGEGGAGSHGVWWRDVVVGRGLLGGVLEVGEDDGEIAVVQKEGGGLDGFLGDASVGGIVELTAFEDLVGFVEAVDGAFDSLGKFGRDAVVGDDGLGEVKPAASDVGGGGFFFGAGDAGGGHGR